MPLTGDSRKDVAVIYVGVFGRAPEKQGLDYWVNQMQQNGWDLKQLAENMYNAAIQYTGYEQLSNTDYLVETLYENILGKTKQDDPDGINYWKTQIETGHTTKGKAIADIIYAAITQYANNPATKTLLNRADVAIQVAEKFDNADIDNNGKLDDSDFEVFKDIVKAVKDKDEDKTKVINLLDNIKQNPNLAKQLLNPTSPSDKDTSIFDKIKQNSKLQEYTDKSEKIQGTDNDDYINGGGGNDTIHAGAGNDVVEGGTGNDKIYGEYGRDYLIGGYGADEIYAIDNSYDSGIETTYIEGYFDKNGNYVGGYYKYIVDVWSEVLDGGGGDDKLYGGYGGDIIKGGDGADYIVGDNDSLYINDQNKYYFTNGEKLDLSVMFNDEIYGGKGDDEIYGKYGNDKIYGGSGDDYIDGGDGNDNIDAGEGNDTIYGGDGDDTIIAGEGNDKVYDSAGNDNVDLGNGDDEVYFKRIDDTHGVIIAGEGSDYINVGSTYNNTYGKLTIDLTETEQKKDVIYFDDISTYDTANNPQIPVEIKGFDLTKDKLDLPSFDLYGTNDWSYEGSQYWNYDHTQLISNYVQIVNSPSTSWNTKEQGASVFDNNPENDGKGVFVIQGAEVDSADKYKVAQFLDAYGNDATYDKNAVHYFLVNIKDTGIGIYMFKDDTGADNVITGDELTPVAVLDGLTTEDINLNTSADFIV